MEPTTQALLRPQPVTIQGFVIPPNWPTEARETIFELCQLWHLQKQIELALGRGDSKGFVIIAGERDELVQRLNYRLSALSTRAQELVPLEDPPEPTTGKEKLLAYLDGHRNEWIPTRTLRTVSAIDDVTRTLRILREEGMHIENNGAGGYRLVGPA